MVVVTLLVHVPIIKDESVKDLVTELVPVPTMVLMPRLVQVVATVSVPVPTMKIVSEIINATPLVRARMKIEKFLEDRIVRGIC